MPEKKKQPEKDLSVNDDFNLEDLMKGRRKMQDDKKVQKDLTMVGNLEKDLNNYSLLEPSELRQGNVIAVSERKNNAGYTEMKELLVTAEILKEIKENPNYLYAPMPISEEWLIRLGFKNLNKGEVVNNWTHIDDEGFEMDVQIEEGGAISSYQLKNFPKMDYVHQLQNYYLKTIGRELSLS